MGAGIVALIGLAAAFVAWRLARRAVAANGVTVMPTLFIQVFGIFMLIGQCFVAYHKGDKVFMVEGVSIYLAMIFVGRNIAKRKNGKA